MFYEGYGYGKSIYDDRLVYVDGDYGSSEGVEVTCDKCGHSEQSGGTHDGSLSRCAYLLRENCPRGENNFYVVTG